MKNDTNDRNDRNDTVDENTATDETRHATKRPRTHGKSHQHERIESLQLVQAAHTMLSSTVIGALGGVAVQCYANVARQLPALASPWMHAASAVVGAGAATYVVGYEEKTSAYVKGKLDNRMGAERARQVAAANTSQ